MKINSLLTIIGMAVMTYATRAGGLWLAGRVHLSKRARRGLDYIPGAVLMSIVAPAVMSSGIAGVCATAITLIVAARTKSLLLAMIAGVGTMVGTRALL